MYNKNEFKMDKNKKILHKKGKQWITISLSMLMFVGLNMASSKLNHASANVTTQQPVTSMSNQKNTNEAQPIHTPNYKVKFKQSNVNQSNDNQPSAPSQVSEKATQIYSHVSSRASSSTNSQSPSNRPKMMFGQAPQSLTSKSSSQQQGIYMGMNYDITYDKTNGNSVNFENGTAQSDLSKFLFKSNPAIKNANTINFNAVDMSHVTSMDRMFAGSKNLRVINFGNNFNTSNVNNMSNMFAGDSNLQQLVLPEGLSTQHVHYMEDMFANDKKLSIIKFPKNFSTLECRNMDNMFTIRNDNIAGTGIGTGTNMVQPMGKPLSNLKAIIVQSPNTIFVNKAGLPTMYDSNDVQGDTTLPTSNDFTKGHTGIFTIYKKPTNEFNTFMQKAQQATNSLKSIQPNSLDSSAYNSAVSTINNDTVRLSNDNNFYNNKASQANGFENLSDIIEDAQNDANNINSVDNAFTSTSSSANNVYNTDDTDDINDITNHENSLSNFASTEKSTLDKDDKASGAVIITENQLKHDANDAVSSNGKKNLSDNLNDAKNADDEFTYGMTQIQSAMASASVSNDYQVAVSASNTMPKPSNSDNDLINSELTIVHEAERNIMSDEKSSGIQNATDANYEASLASNAQSIAQSASSVASATASVYNSASVNAFNLNQSINNTKNQMFMPKDTNAINILNHIGKQISTLNKQIHQYRLNHGDKDTDLENLRSLVNSLSQIQAKMPQVVQSAQAYNNKEMKIQINSDVNTIKADETEFNTLNNPKYSNSTLTNDIHIIEKILKTVVQSQNSLNMNTINNDNVQASLASNTLFSAQSTETSLSTSASNSSVAQSKASVATSIANSINASKASSAKNSYNQSVANSKAQSVSISNANSIKASQANSTANSLAKSKATSLSNSASVNQSNSIKASSAQSIADSIVASKTNSLAKSAKNNQINSSKASLAQSTATSIANSKATSTSNSIKASESNVKRANTNSSISQNNRVKQSLSNNTNSSIYSNPTTSTIVNISNNNSNSNSNNDNNSNVPDKQSTTPMLPQQSTSDNDTQSDNIVKPKEYGHKHQSTKIGQYNIQFVKHHVHYIKFNRKVLLHTKLFYHGHHDKVIHISPSYREFKVIKELTVKRHHHQVIRYEVRYHNHNYFVTGNREFTTVVHHHKSHNNYKHIHIFETLASHKYLYITLKYHVIVQYRHHHMHIRNIKDIRLTKHHIIIKLQNGKKMYERINKSLRHKLNEL